MTEFRDVLERELERLTPPRLGPDRLTRRRDRRIRNQRIAAALVAVGVLLIVIGGLIQAFSARDRTKDIGGEPTPPGVSVATRSDIYELDPSTGEEHVVLRTIGGQYDPERSPDGSRIVFTSWFWASPDRSKRMAPQIFIAEGQSIRQLTDLPNGAVDPTWSPDGTQIAFATRGGLGDIYMVDADGSDLRRVAGTTGADVSPDWSPDGTQIVFTALFQPTSIWVATLPGGDAVQLTHGDEDYGATWSPDGAWIAYTHFLDPTGGELSDADTDLWLMRPDGTGKHALTTGGAFGGIPTPSECCQAESPTWSPDGRSIAILSNNDTIYAVDVATGALDEIEFVLVPVVPDRLSWVGSTAGMQWTENGILIGLDSA